MKTLIALASLTLFANPVKAQSLPTWSTKVAESACTYFALDVSFNDAISQAFDDNDHLESDMNIAHSRGLIGKTLNAAIQQRCPDLYLKADRD